VHKAKGVRTCSKCKTMQASARKKCINAACGHVNFSRTKKAFQELMDKPMAVLDEAPDIGQTKKEVDQVCCWWGWAMVALYGMLCFME
jgi:methylphosphotriester-DNA--protein-cysteine methyltransferase